MNTNDNTKPAIRLSFWDRLNAQEQAELAGWAAAVAEEVRLSAAPTVDAGELPRLLDMFAQAVRDMTVKELEQIPGKDPTPNFIQSGLRAESCRKDVDAAIEAMLRREYERGANQFNWICTPEECGAYNPYDCRQCRVCGSPRPHLHTEAEVEAAHQQGVNTGRLLEVKHWLAVYSQVSSFLDSAGGTGSQTQKCVEEVIQNLQARERDLTQPKDKKPTNAN